MKSQAENLQEEYDRVSDELNNYEVETTYHGLHVNI